MFRSDIEAKWPLKDVMGRWRTQSLFAEFGKPEAIFNLTDFDTPSTLSMKKVYLDLCDVTEYKVAKALLGSWEHWTKLSETTWFAPYLASWRNELELKIKSEAIDSLRASSKEEGAKGANAARWLAEGKWEKKGNKRKERADRVATETEEVNADARRLGLN